MIARLTLSNVRKTGEAESMEMKREPLGNASWRIESEEERELARLADRSVDARVDYNLFYRKHAPEYYEKGITMANRVIDAFRPDASPCERNDYLVDMIYSLHRFGCMYDEYFLMDFEHLNARGRDEFITDKNRWDYYAALNGTEYDLLFRDKAETYKVFKRFYKRDFLLLKTTDDLEAFCAFREKHPSFIVKPCLGSGGRGCFIQQQAAEENSTLFVRLLTIAPVVLEELIQPDPRFSAFHPGSVNTVRIPTVRYADGSVRVFHPFIRVGVGDSVVDNAASGGIFAPIEPETGIIFQNGITESGTYYFRHPNSGIVFPGFQIPEWDDAVKLVKMLADQVPACRYVGWDCALTTTGWVMVEGNLYGQLVDQYATKRGIRRELDEIVTALGEAEMKH